MKTANLVEDPDNNASSVEDPRDVEYKIEINTSWRGTDSKVLFQIHGENGSTGRARIDNPGDTFEPRGKKFDVFYWPAHVNFVGDVGVPYAIEISAPTAKKWGVEEVRVTRIVYDSASRRERKRKKRTILHQTTAEFPTDRRIGKKAKERTVEGVLFWRDGIEPGDSSTSQMNQVIDRLWKVLDNGGSTVMQEPVTTEYELSLSEMSAALKRNTFHEEVNIEKKASIKIDPFSAEASIGLKFWAEQERQNTSEKTVVSTFRKKLEFTAEAPPGKIAFYEIAITANGVNSNYPLGNTGRTLTMVNPTSINASYKKYAELNVGEAIEDEKLRLIYSATFR